MKMPIKPLILGVVVTVVGSAIMAVGLAFSETVNAVSILGIILGAQTLAMGQLLTLKAAWTIYQTSKRVTPATP